MSSSVPNASMNNLKIYKNKAKIVIKYVENVSDLMDWHSFNAWNGIVAIFTKEKKLMKNGSLLKREATS